MSGHEGPVVSVAFNPSPTSTALASVSWDKSLRLWNAIETGSDHESVLLAAGGKKLMTSKREVLRFPTLILMNLSKQLNA